MKSSSSKIMLLIAWAMKVVATCNTAFTFSPVTIYVGETVDLLGYISDLTGCEVKNVAMSVVPAGA